jgi:hypothetical protein
MEVVIIDEVFNVMNILLNILLYVYLLGCSVSFFICIYMEIKIYTKCRIHSIEYKRFTLLDVLEIFVFVFRSWFSVWNWIKFEMFLERMENERKNCKED